jgi:hypothetical protein
VEARSSGCFVRSVLFVEKRKVADEKNKTDGFL